MRPKPFYRRPLFHTIGVTVFLLGVYAGIAWWTQNERTPLIVAFDLLLAALAFLAMTALTAQFVLPVRSRPDQPHANPRLTVIQRLFNYPFGTTGPVMFVQNGVPVESQRERERPGAGVLLVDHTSAAVLRTDTRFTRAVGPGTYFTAPGERLAEALDLRRQARGLRGSPPATGEPIEQDVQNARALTQDGIPISADLGVTFMLDPGHSGPPREGRHPNLPPYEFNPAAAERAVYGHAYEETQDVPWVDMPIRLVVDLWRERTKNWPLEALLTARQDQPPALQVIQREMNERLLPPAASDREASTTMGREVRREYDLLRARGIRVLGAGISNVYLPQDVRDERQRRWREGWIQSIQQAVTEAETLALEARRRGDRGAYETLAFDLTEKLRAELAQGRSPSRRDTLTAILEAALEICRRDGLHVARREELEAQLRKIRNELSRLDGDCRELSAGEQL